MTNPSPALRILAESDLSTYLKYAERRLTEEAERIESYLDVRTRSQLLLSTEKRLVVDHVAAILRKGVEALIDSCAVDDLARLYRLLSRVGQVSRLRVSFTDSIKRVGTDIVSDVEREKDMVTRLLELRGRMDSIVEKAFGGCRDFGDAMKEGFESCVNGKQNKPAELIGGGERSWSPLTSLQRSTWMVCCGVVAGGRRRRSRRRRSTT